MKLSRYLSEVAGIFVLGLVVFGSDRACAQRPIGIDVSDYQSASLNWSTLKNTYGISFAWAKISEGGSSAGGANFTTYAANAKAAGILIGAYHYARYDLNPGTNGAAGEANYFWGRAQNYLKGGGYYLMPMLDVEASFTGQTKTTMSAWINQWCNTVSNNAAAAGYRVKPCIYASSSHAANYFDSTVTKWNLDMAAWPYNHTNTTVAQRAAAAQTGAPNTAPWSTWQFWQYDDQNIAQAITTGDGDIFNGTMAQLTNTMVIKAIGPTLTSQPTNRTVLEDSNTTFSVTATGIGTLHYQWRWNQTNISGATVSSYSIPNVQMNDGGIYSVLVSDNNGNSLSDDASLSVQIPLVNAPGSIVAPTGLVNWWPADGSLNDIFGTLNGTPSGGFSYAPGKSGLAFHFDGSTAIVTNTASNLAVPWTLCLWVNRSNSPQSSALIVGDGTYGLKLEQYNATRQLGLTILGVGDYIFSPAYTVPVGTWTHLAFVGTTAGTTVYANGVLKGSLTNSIPLPRKFMGAAYVTSSARFVDFMLGSMDEILTFNRALSASEILRIYSAGNAGLVRGPEILDSVMTGENQVTVSLKGQTGKNFTIYSSTDLLNWIPFGTLPNANGTNQFTDNTATSGVKFYRASQTY